jgi:hypothetical protein
MDPRLQTFYAIQDAKKQQEKDQKIYELQQGIEGLEEEKRLLGLEEAEQIKAEDENERQTLSQFGIDTYNPRRTIRLTYNNPKGGKRSRRKKTRGKKRRHNKKRRSTKRRR